MPHHLWSDRCRGYFSPVGGLLSKYYLRVLLEVVYCRNLFGTAIFVHKICADLLNIKRFIASPAKMFKNWGRIPYWGWAGRKWLIKCDLPILPTKRHMVSIFLLKLNYRFGTGWQSKTISYGAIQYSLPFFLISKWQIQRLFSWIKESQTEGFAHCGIISHFYFSFSDNRNR